MNTRAGLCGPSSFSHQHSTICTHVIFIFLDLFKNKLEKEEFFYIIAHTINTQHIPALVNIDGEIEEILNENGQIAHS